MPEPLEPSDAQIDRFPVAGLVDRYGIKSAALYNRFDALGIKPLKTGRTSYLTSEQLKQMDELQQHLQRGGGLADFPSRTPVETSPADGADRKLISLIAILFRIRLGPMITSALVNAGKILLPPPLSPARRGLQLAYLREFREAAEESWLITTYDLASLLGVTSGTIVSKKQQFSSSGFVFTRAGKGLNNQIAWEVRKVPIQREVPPEDALEVLSETVVE